MQEKANHDPLTGLPNRLLLADRLSQALARSDRNGTGLAVLFLDLDGFKPINDRMGHDAGDKALIEIANRLSSIVREADTVARVGGDEFVIVISDLDKSSELARTTGCAIAEKCLEAIAVPIEIKGESQIVGFSIGIAFGDRTSTVDELLSGADSAMYLAKQQGKGRYVVADSTHSMSSGI
jgi:diguanylate cyclase (GGDEF)-like protein